MRRWNRSLLLLPVLLLGLVACGDDADPSAEDSPSAREVEHAMGTTEVPEAPARVVVLDSSFLDAALALGVTPVAATEAEAGAGMPAYLAAAVPNIEVVGLTNEPSLEAVAKAKPDLILGAKVRHEALYDKLAEIAPTVFTESSGTNWKEGFTLTAEALGKADEGEKLLDDLAERSAELGAQVKAGGTRASIVRFLLPDEIRIYGPKTFSGSILAEVGFDLGDHDWDEYSMAYLSAEQLGQADADVVFSTSYGGRDNETFRAAFGPVEPAWKSVPAVAAGRQHWVDDDRWMLGIGPKGAGLILDDLQELLTS